MLLRSLFNDKIMPTILFCLYLPVPSLKKSPLAIVFSATDGGLRISNFFISRLPLFVPPKGFEPPTFWSEARRSIQLS